MNNEWIKHAGGKCPVERGVLVDVRYRDGREVYGLPALEPEGFRDATEPFWESDGMAMDITEWRLHRVEQEDAGASMWDGESWPPPVGAKVLSRSVCSTGIKVEVLAVRKGKVIGCICDTGVAGWIDKETTYPIRTDEEVAVQAMMDSFCDDDGHETMKRVYRAIAAGEVPGVRLESTQSAAKDIEDISDPSNWKAGDVVKCVGGDDLEDCFTIGGLYRVYYNDGNRCMKYHLHDGSTHYEHNSNFMFYARPE